MLQLSSMGRRRHSAGVIMNYIAVDAYRMGEYIVVVSHGMESCFATLSCHWNSFQGCWSWSTAWSNSNCSDQLQSWEGKFKEVIDSPRGAEYECLAKSQIRKSSTTVLYWMSPDTNHFLCSGLHWMYGYKKCPTQCCHCFQSWQHCAACQSQ